MFWRALSLYGLSPLLGAGVAAVGWLFSGADGSVHPVALWALLAGLFVLSTFAAALWLGMAESTGAMWRRAWLGAGAAAVAASVIVVWDASGVAEPEFEGGPRCPECPVSGVERIIDGDTLIIGGGMRVRLYGIDAPEIGEPCADEATERLRELAGDAARLESGPRLEDEYGRRLAYLYREDGRSIDAELAWGGYAEAWSVDGQHLPALAELERDAREAGRGCLWSGA